MLFCFVDRSDADMSTIESLSKKYQSFPYNHPLEVNLPIGVEGGISDLFDSQDSTPEVKHHADAHLSIKTS